MNEKHSGWRWWAMAMTASSFGVVGTPSTAWAGIEACNGVRVELESKCRWEVQEVCRERCQQVEVSRVCATQWYRNCRQSCSFSASSQCSGDCNQICEDQCSQGLEVVCQHNCFPECVGACDVQCAGLDNEQDCRAACAATCDGECDAKCADVPPEANCQYHCLECCDGSCRAMSNMDCQVDCQTGEYEVCEVETKTECGEACGEEGAIFCDGELIAMGGAVRGCAEALVELGIATVEAEFDVDLAVESLDDVGAALDANVQAITPQTASGTGEADSGASSERSDDAKSVSCSIGSTLRDASRGGAWSFALVGLVVGVIVRRRRGSAAPWR